MTEKLCFEDTFHASCWREFSVLDNREALRVLEAANMSQMGHCESFFFTVTIFLGLH